LANFFDNFLNHAPDRGSPIAAIPTPVSNSGAPIKSWGGAEFPGKRVCSLVIDEDRLQTPCLIKQFFPQDPSTRNAQKAAELFHQEAVRLDQLGGSNTICSNSRKNY
jgi:hypothetical protein